MAQLSIFDRALRSIQQKNYEEFINWLDILGDEQINAKDSHGSTLLSHAATLGNAYCVSILIDHNADINLMDNYQITPLMAASAEGHITVVQTLLNNPKIELNLKSRRRHTALALAIWNKRFSVVAILLDKSKNVLVNTYDSDGWTPLMTACQHGTPEIVSLLVHHGASINSKNNNHETPLMIASTHGNTNIVKVLLENGASIFDRTPTGWTPIMFASYGGHVDTMKLLFAPYPGLRTEYNNDIMRLANFFGINQYKQNILHVAGYDARLDACKYLIEVHGMDPTFEDEDKNSVLTNYGMWLNNNDPNQPNQENTFWRLRLTPEQKTAAVKELIASREAYLLQVKRNENWKRRWPFMKIMVCCDFQPTIRRKELLQKLYPPLPTNVPIPSLPNRTRAQCIALLRDKILTHPGLWKLIVAFL